MDLLSNLANCVEDDIDEVTRKCERCLRARCVCDFLPESALSTNYTKNMKIIVLQHPSEAKEYKNTVNLMKVCLNNVYILNGSRFKSDGGIWDQACADKDGTFLLFPNKNAIDVKNLYNDVAPDDRPNVIRQLVVIDGTWNSCRRIYGKNFDILNSMRKLCIYPETPSNYRIRKQPNINCLSTIEAVAYVLLIAEQDQNLYDELTRPLDGLVESYKKIEQT
ncbi:DTW domain-containing protein [Acrasis kona]|uniref:tRNA-uridine aminocarboxypropyltransferase n=1 Tax=Acrasis kona TaxID=1008807 RepID=A0AAW2Z9A0_9EUKA